MEEPSLSAHTTPTTLYSTQTASLQTHSSYSYNHLSSSILLLSIQHFLFFHTTSFYQHSLFYNQSILLQLLYHHYSTPSILSLLLEYDDMNSVGLWLNMLNKESVYGKGVSTDSRTSVLWTLGWSLNSHHNSTVRIHFNHLWVWLVPWHLMITEGKRYLHHTDNKPRKDTTPCFLRTIIENKQMIHHHHHSLILILCCRNGCAFGLGR